MPLKISVSAPGGASLTLEVSERDAYGEMAELALNRFPQLASVHNGNGGSRVKGKEVTSSERGAADATTPPEPPVERVGTMPPPSGSGPAGAAREDDAFRAFCHKQAPLGDMRRLVAVAEGARLHLGLERVSVRELGALFERAGWPRPKNLVQTIRNAARSSFRWLERVPGREGYYTVSERGRAAVLKRQ